MDEPFAALDPVIRESLQNDMLELQREFGKTFVFITHDVDEAIRLGSRIGILDHGRLLQVGTPWRSCSPRPMPRLRGCCAKSIAPGRFRSRPRWSRAQTKIP